MRKAVRLRGASTWAAAAAWAPGRAAAWGLARRSSSVALALTLTLAAGVGCRASRPAPEPQAAVGAAPGRIHFQADVAPITALAWTAPHLWIGSDRGLRRVRFPQREAQAITGDPGLAGRRISALAADADGGLWIATDRGVGRLPAEATASEAAPAAGSFRQVALLTNVTRLLPVGAAGAGGNQAWAATTSGLFFIDGAAALPVAAARAAAITSLDADGDGRTVWAGVKGRGLLRLDARAVLASFGPPEGLDFVEAAGTALLRNGTRFAVGRGAAGRTRLLLLQSAGATLLEAQPDVSVLGVVDGPGGPSLLAGAEGAPRLHALSPVQRGEVVGAGGFRFSPVRTSLAGMRLAATADPRPSPPGITAFAVVRPGAGSAAGVSAGDLFLGTREHGVVRVAGDRPRPEHLPGGELALDARALSVACLDRDRCIVATASGAAWAWDGRRLTPQPPPAELGGGAAIMALDTAPDRTAAGAGGGGGPDADVVYAVLAAAPDGRTLSVVRLRTSGSGRWEPVHRFALAAEGTLIPTSLAASPGGDIWIAVRDLLASGQEVGRGVIELQLPAGHVVHHRGYATGEARPPEALPILGDVSAIRFRAGAGGGGAPAGGPGPAGPTASWFCTSVGVLRFAGGALSRWGEDEGLDPERCADLVFDGATAAGGAGVTVWAAGGDGPARFDGKSWRTAAAAGWPADREGEAQSARALADCGAAGLRAGTPHGVWTLAAGRARRLLDATNGLVDEDVQDLACDRFGRLWVLGSFGVTLADVP